MNPDPLEKFAGTGWAARAVGGVFGEHAIEVMQLEIDQELRFEFNVVGLRILVTVKRISDVELRYIVVPRDIQAFSGIWKELRLRSDLKDFDKKEGSLEFVRNAG